MSSNPTQISLYADEKQLLEREVEVSNQGLTRADGSDLISYYELDYVLHWIIENNYKHVALQFPDHMLSDSAKIATHIQTHASNGCRAYVLADTSYGKCCVDEVAAEHVSADALIHFGPACLSANARLPVLYIFGRPSWNTMECATKIKEKWGTDGTPLIILYDVQFYHGIQQLREELAKYSNISIAFIPTQAEQSRYNAASNSTPSSSSTNSEPDNTQISSSNTENQTFCGRQFSLIESTALENHEILYIGGEGSTLTNIIMKYNQMAVWSYDPSTVAVRQESVNVNRSLMKRFYLIEKIKDADIIGIVVGTLSVSNYLDILNYLKKIIKDAGKKYYTFVMGKLNIPKLANFAEIDIFVLVACPENSLLDSKEFFRPIATPFELEIGLVRGKEWSNRYSTDFAEVLKSRDIKSIQEEVMNDGSQNTEADDVRISLVSRKVKTNPKNTALAIDDEQNANEDAGAPSVTEEKHTREITTRAKMELEVSMPAASTYFLQRTFQGLQQRLGEDTPHVATEGHAGIAAGYDNELNRNSS